MRRGAPIAVGTALLAVGTALLALGAALPGTAGAQELGRLFLTPEQRAQLEARRKARVPDTPAAAPVLESPLTRLDGSVRRPGGRSTVWVNGETIPEGAHPDGAKILRPHSSQGRVPIAVGESERRFDLRVGETLNRDSGEVRDLIGGGKIEIKPGDAKPR